MPQPASQPQPPAENWRDLARHWLKFNAVGALGILVQLAALFLLVDGLGCQYQLATLLAVETAILHNFAWHERWTWADRTRHHPGGMFLRLLQFNLATGLISLLGNVVFMTLLVGRWHLHYLLANLLSIAACYLLNFAASEWLVFRTKRNPTCNK